MAALLSLITLVAVVLMGRHLMATLDDLNAKITAIAANVAEIGDDLAEVIEKLPSDGGLTAAEVEQLAASLDAIVAQTRTVADVVPEPPPTE